MRFVRFAHQSIFDVGQVRRVKMSVAVKDVERVKTPSVLALIFFRSDVNKNVGLFFGESCCFRDLVRGGDAGQPCNYIFLQ